MAVMMNSSGGMLGKKEEGEGGGGEWGPFSNFQRTNLVLDSRVFNDTPLSAKAATAYCRRLLFAVHAEQLPPPGLSSPDATAIFFSVLKAFQSKDVHLRRLMYIALKELAPLAQDVMMATSSLVQDIGNAAKLDAVVRAEALRALGRIVDPAMIGGVERVLKQALLDPAKQPAFVSAALVTCLQLHEASPQGRDWVRRWAPEATQCLAAAPRASIAQYHALGLLHAMRQGDRVAVAKLTHTVHSSSAGPFATALFLRIYGGNVLTPSTPSASLLDLKGYLRCKGRQEMVALEACRVVCAHPERYGEDLPAAVASLQAMLQATTRPVLRLAALRTLQALARLCPGPVVACNRDLEALVGDGNRSIATLAITTLLKTGTEQSVDRLVQQAGSYVSEISDDFKVLVVRAVRELCFKFPGKAGSLLDFFSGILREEGSLEYKGHVVQAIEDLLELQGRGGAPGLASKVLASLCEFIEDCEYPALTAQVLRLLGERGPALLSAHQNQPADSPSLAGHNSADRDAAMIVRYVYNRMVLETAPGRKAAINALLTFAVLSSSSEFDSASNARALSTKGRILPILKRTAECDEDYGVRQEAAMAVNALTCLSEPAQRLLFDQRLLPDLDDLEVKLQEYLGNEANFSAPFDLQEQNVKMLPREQCLAKLEPKSLATAALEDQETGEEGGEEPMAAYGLGPQDIEAFALPGSTLLLSRPPQLLTDENAECTVSVIKHLFVVASSSHSVVSSPALLHFLLEFVCENTESAELTFSDVQVALPPDLVLRQRAIPSLGPLQRASTLTLVAWPQGDSFTASIPCQLRFRVNNGSQENFPIGDLEVTLSDFVQPIGDDIFLDAEVSKEETFHLTAIATVPDAVRILKDMIGGQAYALTSDKPNEEVLQLQGRLLRPEGPSAFICRCRLSKLRGQAAGGVQLTMHMASNESSTVEAIMNVIS